MLEPKDTKAPAWMGPFERRIFRRLIASEINENRYISQQKFDQICDYTCASARLDDLRERLQKEIAAGSLRDVDRARILTLNTQINALVALRQKLADSL